MKIGVFTLTLILFSAATAVAHTDSSVYTTDKNMPGPKANEDARHAADAAANKPCLKKQQQ